MNSIHINSYELYQFGENGINFSDYYNPRNRHQPPQPLTYYLIDNMPSNIHTIVNFGCACGKDFIPFQHSHKIIGFDIAPVDKINWVCDTTNLTYYECSIQDFMYNIDMFDFEWKNVLVYTHGALMYVSHDIQEKFVNKLISKGCENMALEEYEKEAAGMNPYLNLSSNTLCLFKKVKFYESATEATAHILLKK